MPIKENEKGMTLIEVIIVIVVMGIMMGVLYQIFITGHTIFTKSQYEENLIQNARVAMDWIVRDVREADSIHVSTETLTIMKTSTSVIIYQPMIDNKTGSRLLGRKINGKSILPITSPDTYLKTCEFTPIFSSSSPSVTIGVNVKLELVPFNVSAQKIVKGQLNTIRTFILESKVFVRRLILNK